MKFLFRKLAVLRCLGIIFLLLPLFAACSGGDQTPKSTPSPTPSIRLAAMTPDSLKLAYEDDFSTARWPVSADEKVTYQYLDGEYRISVNAPLVMKAFGPFPKQSNVVTEVQAKLVASGSNSGYGIAFRENGGDYYYLRISGNRYGIDKRFQQNWETLHSLTKSDYIKADGSPNTLRVACLGDTIEVSVNGQWLATIKDSSFSEGRIALVAEGAEGKDTVATFDNFKIYTFNDAYLQKNAPQFLVANKTPVPTPSPTAVPTPTSTPTFEQKRTDVLRYLKSYNTVMNSLEDALQIIPLPAFDGKPQDLPALKIFASQTGMAAAGALNRLSELKASSFEPETSRIQERTLAYLRSIQKVADAMSAAAASGDSAMVVALMKGFDDSEGAALNKTQEELLLKYNISDLEASYRRVTSQNQQTGPAGATGSTSTTRQYTNTEWGYSVQVPRDWSIDDSNKAVVTLATQGISILIAADTTQAGVEVSKYVDSVVSFYRSASPDFQELSRNRVMLPGNVPAISQSVKYTSKGAKDPHTELRLFAVTADRNFMVVGLIFEPDASWSKYTDLYNAIAGSLTITAMPSGKSTPTATPSAGQGPKRTLNLGPRVQVVTNTSGGTVSVQQPGNLLDALSIQVPAGAYTDTGTFQVSYQPVQSHTFGQDITPISPLITIQRGGGYAKKPIRLNIPVKVPADNFAMVFFYDSTNGQLEGVPFITGDNNSVTVATRRFGDFVVLSALHTTIMTRFLAESAPGSGFVPGKDDWEFVNEGSWLSPGGICQGSSLSELWYYDEVVKKTPNAKQLWNQYDNNKGKPTQGFWHDDSLAYRLASVVHDDSRVDAPNIGNEEYFEDQVFYAFVVSMYLTGEPQFVGLGVKGDPSTGHAIVAYKMAKDRIYVADPNFPGKERSIPFNGFKFDTYSSGENAKVIGVGDVNYNIFQYYGKTALMDWGKVAASWRELDGGTIGSTRFPTYQLTLIDDTGKTYDATAKDLTVSSKKISIQITSQARLNLGLYRDGNWVDKGEANTSPKLKLDVELKDGVNELGVYITGDPRSDAERARAGGAFQWSYTDFKWISVNCNASTTQTWIASLTGSSKINTFTATLNHNYTINMTVSGSLADAIQGKGYVSGTGTVNGGSAVVSQTADKSHPSDKILSGSLANLQVTVDAPHYGQEIWIFSVDQKPIVLYSYILSGKTYQANGFKGFVLLPKNVTDNTISGDWRTSDISGYYTLGGLTGTFVLNKQQ